MTDHSISPGSVEVAARAIMLSDGCGLTINGERVFCDDPRALEKPDRCYCKRSAKAAVDALRSPDAAARAPASADSIYVSGGDYDFDLLTDLVARFSAALLEKLKAAEAKYGHNSGWARDDWRADCQRHLNEHLAKGDPRDVAAYCAFLWHHGWPTIGPITPREYELVSKLTTGGDAAAATARQGECNDPACERDIKALMDQCGDMFEEIKRLRGEAAKPWKLETIDAIISDNVYVDNDGVAGISAAAEAILEQFSCGAESNRHSGAVGTDKRAEQSNPGGGHEVTEHDAKKLYEQKAAGMIPRPAASPHDVAQPKLEPLEALACLFSESAHETWTREEIVNIIEDAIRLGSPHSSTNCGAPSNAQFDADLAGDAEMTSTEELHHKYVAAKLEAARWKKAYEEARDLAALAISSTESQS